ncbi:hypothetical protein AB0O07_16740 [Streptomyces sp. NPDC093085]|uniref:hypothetical protein n=1 Tax=Streptomyces sp. NPDC093085 TaxID=3155068 RepID=UPI003438C41A
MSDLEFYTTAMIRGELMGANLLSDPEEWEAALGHEYVDDVKKSRMRRDYGLIEVHFTRSRAWKCTGVSLQVHRLAWDNGNLVPAPLIDRYGAFSSRVPFETVRRLLTGGGCRIDEDRAKSQGEYATFSVRRTPASIVTLRNPGEDEPFQPGDIWSITLNPMATASDVR